METVRKHPWNIFILATILFSILGMAKIDVYAMRINTYFNDEHSYTQIDAYDDFNHGFNPWAAKAIGMDEYRLNQMTNVKKVTYNGSYSADYADGVYTFNISNVTLNRDRDWNGWWGWAIDIETVSGKHFVYDLYPQDYHYIGYDSAYGNGSCRAITSKSYASYDIFPIAYRLSVSGGPIYYSYNGRSHNEQGPLSGTINIKDSGPEKIKKITFYLMNTNRAQSSSYGYYPNLVTGQYAIMGELIGGFNITFNVNGGSASISSQTVSSISLPNPGTRPFYTFDGWYNGDTYVGKTGDKWKPTANAALTARWHPNLYYNGKVIDKVVYNGNPITQFTYNLKKIFS